MIPIHQLQYFAAVAAEHSFTAAAARFAISQSAVSQQIRALEDHLGLPLIERRDIGIRLTPAGQSLLEAAWPLLRQYGEFATAIRQLEAAPRPPLRVALPPDWPAAVIWYRIARRWRRSHPQDELKILPTPQGTPDPNDCDLIVTRAAHPLPPGFASRPLGKFLTTVAISSRLHRQDPRHISPAELAELTLLICARDEAALSAACLLPGITSGRQQLKKCKSVAQARKIVAEAGGVLLLTVPAGAAHTKGPAPAPGIIEVSVDPPLPPQDLIVAGSPDPTGRIGDLMDLICTEVRTA